jgi:hypothetical protein
MTAARAVTAAHGARVAGLANLVAVGIEEGGLCSRDPWNRWRSPGQPRAADQRIRDKRTAITFHRQSARGATCDRLDDIPRKGPRQRKARHAFGSGGVRATRENLPR